MIKISFFSVLCLIKSEPFGLNDKTIKEMKLSGDDERNIGSRKIK